jgi:DNA-binding GntR family transcriptional regulator
MSYRKARRSQSKLAYTMLKEHILAGALEANSRLTGIFLTDKLGISKNPIRDALHRLNSEGLVSINTRKGASVRSPSVGELIDLWGVREALEAHVVRTVELTPILLEELRKSMERSLEVTDASRVQESVHFHVALANATRNPRLCAVLDNVRNQLWLLQRNAPDLCDSNGRDHRSIVEALIAGDRDTAQYEMRNHIQDMKWRLMGLGAPTT